MAVEEIAEAQMIGARRVLGYARVSSEDQAQGTSLKDQQNAIGAYAKSKRLPSPAFYVEAESGIREKEERREQMRKLLAAVREGDLVVCAKIDRWSRDPEFTYRSIRQILAAGASFYAVDDACDPSTNEGDTMLNFRILFAREEHKRIKQRMVGTRRILRDRGYYVEGLPPYGYRRAHPKGYKGAEKNILVIEPKEAELVRRAFAMSIAGSSRTTIGAALGITRDRVNSVLNSRVYLGEVQNTAGEWIKARHPPIIDADVYARARAAQDDRRRGPKPGTATAETSTWILRDVARCALCGARMSAAYNGKGPKRRHYYRCFKRCTSRYVLVPDIEAEAAPMVLARLVELRAELARPPKATAAEPVRDLAKRRKALQTKRERFIEAYGDGLMTRDELRARMAKLDGESLRLDGEEHAAKKTQALDGAPARRALLAEVKTLRTAWQASTLEERRTIVGLLAHAAKITLGQPCVFEWRSAEEMAEATQ